MFKIESKDDPAYSYRVHMLRGITTTTVIVKKFRPRDQTWRTEARREFTNHEQAESAYNVQCKLLTCLVKAVGDNFKITENEETASPQLTLEIAA